MPTPTNKGLARHITTLAIVTAMALGVQWLESLLPAPVPGVPIHLGLANTFTLFMLIRHTRRDALIVTLLRCALFILVTGNVSSIFYSFAGSIISYAVMALLLAIQRKGHISAVGLSIAGAFAFNLGQLLAGAVIVSPAVLTYLTPMGLLSIPAGAATGLIVLLLDRRLPANL